MGCFYTRLYLPFTFHPHPHHPPPSPPSESKMKHTSSSSTWREHLFTLAGLARIVAVVSLYIHAVPFLLPSATTLPPTTFILFAALQTAELVLRIPEMFKMHTLSGQIQSIGMAVAYGVLVVVYAVPYIHREVRKKALVRGSL